MPLATGPNAKIQRMAKDHAWEAVEKVIREGLDDKDVLNNPPQTDEDVMWLAATLTDHVVAAFRTEERGR